MEEEKSNGCKIEKNHTRVYVRSLWTIDDTIIIIISVYLQWRFNPKLTWEMHVFYVYHCLQLAFGEIK